MRPAEVGAFETRLARARTPLAFRSVRRSASALGNLLAVVTGVVMAARANWVLHPCPNCGIPI